MKGKTNGDTILFYTLLETNYYFKFLNHQAECARELLKRLKNQLHRMEIGEIPKDDYERKSQLFKDLNVEYDDLISKRNKIFEDHKNKQEDN